MQTLPQLLPSAEIGAAQQKIPVTKIYCASYAFSGVWAFSPETVKAFAPREMLIKGEFSSGEVWEAELQDLEKLWAFSPVATSKWCVANGYKI